VLLALVLVTGAAHAAESDANTPKLALRKVELWLAAAEPKPSVADLDAGVAAAASAEERMAMLNTEIGAVSSRRRTLQLQERALRQKIAELREAPKGENGIKRSGTDQKIADLEQKADAIHAQIEPLDQQLHRISIEETGIVNAVGRVRGVADMIETSSLADAKQKKKALVLADRTTKTIRIHAAIIMTMTTTTAANE